MLNYFLRHFFFKIVFHSVNYFLSTCAFLFIVIQMTWWFAMPPFRRLCLLSRWERSGVAVGGHPRVRHHQAEDQRVVSPPASLRDSRQKIWTGRSWRRCAYARTCSGGWIPARGCERHWGARHKRRWSKKKSAFTVNVVEHCAFCGLKSFSVLPQPAGGSLSNHFVQLQSSCSIWNLLF